MASKAQKSKTPLLPSRQSSLSLKLDPYELMLGRYEVAWYQVTVPADEEEKDYVAHSHYLKNVTPREAREVASRDNYTAPVVASAGEQALGEHREVLAKQWSDSQSEISGIMKEAKEQQKTLQTNLETAQKRIQELEEANKTTQAEVDRNLEEAKVDADRKLEEAKADAKTKVNTIARRSIYRAWFANSGMDLSFLGDKAGEMLAYYEQTKKEETGNAEDEVKEKEPTKSPNYVDFIIYF
uniref:Uncharacterized protein n=1 Tax=Cannabis sativa TaxID=3483 RepID=A0A803QDW3_CANSA